jgi:hypothetical protein
VAVRWQCVVAVGIARLFYVPKRLPAERASLVDAGPAGLAWGAHLGTY